MLQGSKHRATEPAGDTSPGSSALPAFLAGICFLHDWDQFLLWENSIGASHPEEILQSRLYLCGSCPALKSTSVRVTLSSISNCNWEVAPEQ